jgi:hypothetical protein
MSASPNNPQSAIRNPQSPLTDSPWFYVLAFSLMALLALAVIGPKYGRRQAVDERKYQARQRIEDERAARINPDAEPRKDVLADRRQYSMPGDTLVPLWPLAAILSVATLFAGYMLHRGRVARQTSSETSTSLPHKGPSP